jgi:hypothetical protein
MPHQAERLALDHELLDQPRRLAPEAIARLDLTGEPEILPLPRPGGGEQLVQPAVPRRQLGERGVEPLPDPAQRLGLGLADLGLRPLDALLAVQSISTERTSQRWRPRKRDMVSSVSAGTPPSMLTRSGRM